MNTIVRLHLIRDVCIIQARAIGAAAATLLVLGIAQPVVFSSVVLLAATSRGDARPIPTLVGAGLIGLWAAIVWEGGQILWRERLEGTLPALVAAQEDAQLILWAKSLSKIVLTSVLIACSIAATALLFGVRIRIENPSLFVASSLLAILSASLLSLALGNIFILTRHAARVAEALMYPVFILGGLLIPLDALPAPFRALAWLVSLHWAKRLLTTAVDGTGPVAAELVALVLTSVFYFVIARVGFHQVMVRVRRTGSLDLV